VLLLRVVRRRHQRRRDARIAALRRHLPAATVRGAAAGLHLTVTFDEARGEPVDDLALAARALAAGVKVQPLSWHRVRPGPPGLVLGYAASPAGQLAEAIAALAPLVGDPAAMRRETPAPQGSTATRTSPRPRPGSGS
jgi:GntR family transcriptional regulator/MocR family aminotransferase